MTALKMLIGLAILAIVATETSAKDYVVGDEKGWTLNFNYTAWAQDKEFWVSDKLIFKYPVGAHDVMKVDGASFKQCVPPKNTEALTSGEDVITLATPGRKWYICSIGKHCEVGQMKLFVNVLSQVGSPTLAPAPEPASSSASGINISKLYILIIGVFGFLEMILG